jgi:integrase/recombinase XerD
VVRVALAVVHDLREARVPAGPDELAAFETDTLAGLVLARAAAGLADSTIAGEVIHLEQVRAWLGRPLWTMQPADADAYFGQVLRGAARGTRLARAQALRAYFLFLEILCTCQTRWIWQLPEFPGPTRRLPDIYR